MAKDYTLREILYALNGDGVTIEDDDRVMDTLISMGLSLDSRISITEIQRGSPMGPGSSQTADVRQQATGQALRDHSVHMSDGLDLPF